MGESQGEFRILTVCTGNICRSPAAERLIARHWAHGNEGITVASAGTGAMVGEPIYISMAHLLEQAGAYSGEFAAQNLTEQLLTEADLVLGMTRRHRAAAARAAPAISGRAFTLKQFARLSAEASVDFEPSESRVVSLHNLVERVTAQQGPVADPDVDDIADPYGRDLDAYQTAFAQIARSVDVVTRVLAGEAVPPGAVEASPVHESPPSAIRPEQPRRRDRRPRRG